jgi:AraC family transcriptional regulator
MNTGYWRAAGVERPGFNHVHITTMDCVLEVLYNGSPKYKGHCARGTIIFARADEEILFSGNGPARSLQVSFTSCYLDEKQEAAGIFSEAVVELQRQNFSVDIGLAKLAYGYAFAQHANVSVSSLYVDILRRAILHRIFVLCSRATSGRTGYSEMLVPTKARRVIEYIEADLKCDLTLSQLSAVVGISRSHFARAFRNSVGMSPHQFVRHCRLAKAMNLIRDHKLSLAEISHSCGFADQAHLTRTFKLQYGENPTYFGKKCVEENSISASHLTIHLPPSLPKRGLMAQALM